MRAMVLVMATVCGALWAASAQETPESVGSKVIALENAWNRASETKDLKALDQILDDSFVYVGYDGRQLNKAEVLKDVKESGVQQVVAESMIARVHGETVIVTGLYQFKGVMRGKVHVERGRFVDTWMYRNGGWVAMSSVSVPGER